jgi:serine/threonine-protein kinase
LPTLLRKGSRMGKYRLDRRIGRGAFAEVWKARDTVEHRAVALKVMHPQAVAEWGRRSIEHEARIASRLEHPGVVAIRNADWIDDRFVIATDLAAGNLAGYSKARRSGPTALEVIREVAAGLAYAHSQGVLHRDVKPENILIFADGRAVLGDFGASRFSKGATRTVTEAGTLGYMAPEQAYGRARFASDVFSLGLIAYEILTGVLPTWPFGWPPDGYGRFKERVPEPLRPVLRKAAEFQPQLRYPDAVALYQALEKAFAKVEQGPRRRNPRRRRRRVAVPSPLAVQFEAFRRAHGKGLGLRYSCHRCDGPISEAMSFCPWCGASDNSFRNITSFPLICPECERGVRSEWNACPWCFKGRFVGNGRKPPPDRWVERRCGRRGCAGELRPFMRYCPLCKRKTRRVWSHRDLPDRCPRCRWPTSHAFLRFCPWCGRREPRAGTFIRRKNKGRRV